MHEKEFRQLTPSTALGVLAALREVLPGITSSAQEPQVAPLMQPLLQQETRWAVARRDQLMAATNWAELSMTLNDLPRETVDVLRALARTQPGEADRLFLHLFEIAKEGVRVERPFDSSHYPSSEHSFIQWLQACCSVPALLNRVMKTAEQQRAVPLPDDWMKRVTAQMVNGGRLSDANFAVALVEALPFTKEAPEFRAYKVPGENSGTLLGELVDHFTHFGDGRGSADVVRGMLLAKQPSTFGSELMLAMMHRDNNKTAITEFVKRRAADLSRLNATAQEEMAILLSHEIKGFEKPETLDADLRAAAAPILARQQILSDQRVADIMKAATVADTHLTDPEFRERTPILLQHLADTDLPAARRFLTKVTELVRLNEPRHKDDLDFYSVANWLMRSSVAPQLYPDVMAEAQRAGLLAENPERDWFMSYVGNLTAGGNLKDGIRIMGFLEATSLLQDAPRFDPIGVVDRQFTFQTVMEMLAYNLHSVFAGRQSAAIVLEELKKRSPRTFGSDLMLVLLDSDPVGAMAKFVPAHAAEWSQIAPEHRLAMAGLLRPMISRMEAARLPEVAEIKRILQPVLEVEAQHELDYLPRIMEAKTFEALGTKYYHFHNRLTWLLEWMVSTGVGDPKVTLAKACQLYKPAAPEAQGWDGRPGDSAMGYLLGNLAYSPLLHDLVMNEAATWKMADDDSFRSRFTSSHSHLLLLWSGATSTKSILLTSRLMGDAAHFDALLYVNGIPYSQLEYLPPQLQTGYKEPMRVSVLSWLKEQPKNFGTELLIAALEGDPSATMPAFMQSHADDLAKLPEGQRAAVERLGQRLIKQQEVRERQLRALKR